MHDRHRDTAVHASVLLKCGRPYSGQGAKSGQFAYYICVTLFREGAGTCSARYLNAPTVEDFVVKKIRERILTEETIVELVTLVAEEVDAMAGELSGRLEVIDAELTDVRKRLERRYEALETSELTLEVLSPRIFSLRHCEEQLEAARERVYLEPKYGIRPRVVCLVPLGVPLGVGGFPTFLGAV